MRSRNDKEHLEQEISQLTQIPVLTMQKLYSISSDVISHLVAEAKQEGFDNVDIDIGFGTLRIEFTEESVLYKFIPDKRLQESVRLASVYGASQLEKSAEDSLAKRIKETYMGLL